MTIADLIRYQHGDLASQVKGNSQLGSLEKQLLAMGGTSGDGFYLSAMSDEQHRQFASKVYADKYQEVFDSSRLGDLFQYYENAGDFKLDDYFNAQEKRLLKIKLSPYVNKTIKEIKEEIKAHLETLKNAAGTNGARVSENEILNAEANKLAYGEILEIIDRIEQIKGTALEIGAINVGNNSKIAHLKDQLIKDTICGIDPKTKTAIETLRDSMYSGR